MNKKHYPILCLALIAAWLSGKNPVYGQLAKNQLNSLALKDLSSFSNPDKNWQLVSDVQADLQKNNVLKETKGTGILVNVFDERKPGKDLLFNFQHGDLDLEMDYMMAKSSNSGIFLQGKYEIQLMDSWGIINPTANDNGGIYERWDDNKPQGMQGYEGHSARQNVSRAPGLWQHIKISFQAPRFDATGKKTENAKVLLIELNGVRIQEDLELSGPTRGALNSQEQALGPLRFQGDHGAVAFRNIQYTVYDKPRPELINLNYAVYKGNFENEPDYKKLPPEAEGPSVILTSNISQLENEFLIHYTGSLKVNQPGEYSFNLNVPGGSGLMRINNNVVVPLAEGRSKGKITLDSGVTPFDLYYSKVMDWAKPALGLSVAGPGIREYVISDANISSNDPVDPILINAPANIILRSFIDVSKTKRVTHAINVGSNKQVHYTYDADNGMMVQLWRGGFLDATPMWHERGDGSSVAAGSLHLFGNPVPAVQKLNTVQASWKADTTGSGFKPKGYVLDVEGRPSFRYITYGTMVTDATKVLENGQGIHREIELQSPVENLYALLITADSVEELSNGLYLVDDKSYYLQIDDSGNAKPIIRNAGEKKQLLVPIRKKISYSILF